MKKRESYNYQNHNKYKTPVIIFSMQYQNPLIFNDNIYVIAITQDQLSALKTTIK